MRWRIALLCSAAALTLVWAGATKTREPAADVVPSHVPARFVMPFSAKTRQEAQAWQEKARARLLELVEKLEPRVSTREVPIDLQLGPPQDKGPYTLYEASFRANSKTGLRYPGLLAIPKGRGPFPAMLTIHGHEGSAADVFNPALGYRGMADRFAQGGYVVFAPSFPHQAFAEMVLWDLIRSVDILLRGPKWTGSGSGLPASPWAESGRCGSRPPTRGSRWPW